MMLFDPRRQLILASASPRRLALLRQIGLEPLVAPADIREYDSCDAAMDAAALALANAELKARAVAGQYPQAIVLAADTVVELNNALLGKPADGEQAQLMLRQLSGQQHHVYTGLCLIDGQSGRCVSGTDRTAVFFNELDEQEISAYAASGAPLDKAGGYGIQDAAGLFVRRIVGDYTTVVGLPLSLLRSLARQL